MSILDSIVEATHNQIAQTYVVAPEQRKKFQAILNTDAQRQAFGDLSFNAPLVLAGIVGKPPRVIAQTITQTLKHAAVERIEIAGPGFINLFLTADAYKQLATELITQDNQFFKQPSASTHYSIEFVSANPTGPLHFGHGRGGIIGDVLGNVLRFLGYPVTKEFYINDAGSQIHKLGLSLKVRCLQQLNQAATLPEDGYQGEYLIDLAKKCVQAHGSKILELDDSFFEQYATIHLLTMIKETLASYGITYDVWFSEKTLHDSNAIRAAVEYLKQHDYTYEQDGALWFKASQFGDEKDRVIRKNDGQWTYLASDIAYMRSKTDRGAQHLVMVLGQDHHGYVDRIHGLQKALGLEQYPVDIILYQLVSLSEQGQKVRMSKRAGRIVTLQDIIDTVGRDVARFFFLHRKADAHLDFDLELALKKTEENPVYYVQYAYVRMNSILQKAASLQALQNITLADIAGTGPSEYLIIKKIAALKEVLETIAHNYQTHQLTYYALELSQLFHSYYGAHKIINLENVPQSRARLLVLQQLQRTLSHTLDILGISTPQSM